MLNKDEYKSAVAKIKASDKFKEKAEASMKASSTEAKSFKIKRPAAVFAALLVVAFISAIAIGPLQKSMENKTNYVINNKNSGETDTDDFKITSQDSNAGAKACYAAIVYLDGYAYSPSSWLSYSRTESSKTEYEKLKGEKLGTVTLDLKGKTYTGTPPSFSSTLDVGTEIYTVKNIKKERAILVIQGEFASIYYRESKAVRDLKAPINLNLAQVFGMISDSPEVSSVELRSEEDGSWMGRSEDKKLLELSNKELPKLSLLQADQFEKNPYESGNRIPINLIFSDGAALHMQVLPEAKSAFVFGAFVRLSEELCSAVKELPKQVPQYPTISKLLPYTEDQISYLYLLNHTNGDEVLCKTPQWSRSALYSIFNYYRMVEAQDSDAKKLVMTAVLGNSKENSVTIDFYENIDKHIIIKLKDKYFKPVNGQISFEELDSFLYNSTDLGIK
jgi:hypothetical protein